MSDILKGLGSVGTSSTVKKSPRVAFLEANNITIREGKATQSVNSQSSGGVNSPLVETDFADREYFPSKGFTSPDGIFTFNFTPIKKVKFKDSSNKDVIIEFKEPV